jgi:hypothetical protein
MKKVIVFAGALLTIASMPNLYTEVSQAMEQPSGTNPLIEAYKTTILNGPRRLVNELNSDKIAEARETVRALYFAWEAISRDSALYSPDLATQICANGMSYSCRGIELSQEALRKLYIGFSLHNTLSLEKSKELAAIIRLNASLE